jgi:hypothetical protein
MYIFMNIQTRRDLVREEMCTEKNVWILFFFNTMDLYLVSGLPIPAPVAQFVNIFIVSGPVVSGKVVMISLCNHTFFGRNLYSDLIA